MYRLKTESKYIMVYLQDMSDVYTIYLELTENAVNKR